LKGYLSRIAVPIYLHPVDDQMTVGSDSRADSGFSAVDRVECFVAVVFLASIYLFCYS